MFENTVILSPWLGAALVALAYAGGYWLALSEARLYYAGAQKRFVYREGYPLAREYG